MATNRTKKQDYNEAYNNAWPMFGAWQGEARKDVLAYLGQIYTAKERQTLRLRNSDVLNIQLIRRLVKWVSGYQTDHRTGIKFDAVEGSDKQAADDFTELITHVMQQSRGYSIISRAFEHALKTGLSLVNTFSDSNQDIGYDHLFYNQFLLDPGFTRLDLKDCRFGIIRKFITKSQAKILLPESKHGFIDNLDDERPKQDEKFPNYHTPIVHGNKLLAYDEFQERTLREEIVIIDKQTGKETIWQGTKQQLEQLLPAILQRAGIPAEMVKAIKRQVPTVEVTALINGEVASTGIDPFGLDDFSFTPIWCYYDPECTEDFRLRLQGFVRALKEIQRAESKRIIAEIAWYENQAWGGLDFEEGTLVDEEDAFKTGPGPRKFTKGALADNKVRDRQVPSTPPGNLNLHQVLEEAMPKTIGINPEMMGAVPNGSRAQISGLVTELRMGAGLTGLRGLFDDLGTSQDIIGGKSLKLIQRYPIERVRRILGREPAKEILTNSNFGKYDATASEAALTKTQRNIRYQELLTMKEMGAKMGDPTPISWLDIIEVSPMLMSGEQMQKINERERQRLQQKQFSDRMNMQMQTTTLQALQAEAARSQAAATESPSKIAKNVTGAQLNQAKVGTENNNIQNNNSAAFLNQVTELGNMVLAFQNVNKPQPLQKGGEE